MAMIKVRAKSIGYIKRLIKKGEEFTIDEEAFAKSWMEPVDPNWKPDTKPADKAPAKPADKKPDSKPAA
ncbi:hypothetical protein [Thalassospira xiamenensis]|uniref:hypothetical protein n=1 Tax=Thalassospira xiamenensis TaxID=220697 RepID=UPI003AA904DD